LNLLEYYVKILLQLKINSFSIIARVSLTTDICDILCLWRNQFRSRFKLRYVRFQREPLIRLANFKVLRF